ncbi:MAG: carbohydrate ABC transporter permease [Lachnospiraceae bacterium]|nr:carbohydrate ABC transporter permease [Lachnospiraceae bacterium]
MTKKVKIQKYSTYWDRNKKSGGYLFRKDVTNVLVKFCRFVLLFGLCFLILIPLFNKISVSFMKQEDLYNPIVVSVPLHFTGENYQLAAKIMKYGEGLKNSIIFSLALSVIQTAMCTIVGYGFARFKFPLKKMWFAFVLGMIIIPPQAFSSSLYLHFNMWDFLGIVKLIKGQGINLRGSAIPYFMMSFTCCGLKNGLYIYLVRQFFRNIPIDLEEAAYVDGCGMMKTFVRIMLPEAKPIITSCFLFSLVWQWTDGFYSKLFLGNNILVSTELSRLVDSLGVYVARELGGGTNAQVSVSTQYSNAILATGTLMIVFPILVVYLFAQRAFVESISSTGIKM